MPTMAMRVTPIPARQSPCAAVPVAPAVAAVDSPTAMGAAVEHHAHHVFMEAIDGQPTVWEPPLMPNDVHAEVRTGGMRWLVGMWRADEFNEINDTPSQSKQTHT